MKDQNAEHQSAADLLGDWRAAGRDTVAAQTAASVAALAVAAAKAAEEAAAETEAAAEAAGQAAALARSAADKARRAAKHAAQAADLLTISTEGDLARADQAVVVAQEAETGARDRFHEAQSQDFPSVRARTLRAVW